MWTDACWTRNEFGQKVTAHQHYRDICHAYPGPDGEVMLAGHVLSLPLEKWLRENRRRHATGDPADRAAPPCPSCGTPVDIEWCEISALGESWRSYIPGRIECPADRRHDVRAAGEELSWPAALTDEDRVWLRKQHQLAEELAAAERALRAETTEETT